VAHSPVITQPTLTEEQLLEVERGKIKGAIRTDFVLSAEIIVIALGTMAAAPLSQQVLSLSLVSLAATVLVYGLVAGIVKIDDAGLALHRRGQPLGAVLLRTAPLLMKALSVLGTAAMFTVGGGIIAHGWHAAEVVLEGWAHATGPAAVVVKPVLDALLGVVCGGVLVGLYSLVQKARSKGGH
jgi:predicted DNA repair protein MutK